MSLQYCPVVSADSGRLLEQVICDRVHLRCLINDGHEKRVKLLIGTALDYKTGLVMSMNKKSGPKIACTYHLALKFSVSGILDQAPAVVHGA